RLLVEDGIVLCKYWFSVSDAEQEIRFRKRLEEGVVFDEPAPRLRRGRHVRGRRALHVISPLSDQLVRP
ncbi:hypothetical protein AB0I04_21555, partial [Actinoallomurus sp. NPDC050550]